MNVTRKPHSKLVLHRRLARLVEPARTEVSRFVAACSSAEKSMLSAPTPCAGTAPARKNRIPSDDFLSRPCAFSGRLEPMLLGDPSQIFFQRYRGSADMADYPPRLVWDANHPDRSFRGRAPANRLQHRSNTSPRNRLSCNSASLAGESRYDRPKGTMVDPREREKDRNSGHSFRDRTRHQLQACHTRYVWHTSRNVFAEASDERTSSQLVGKYESSFQNFIGSATPYRTT